MIAGMWCTAMSLRLPLIISRCKPQWCCWSHRDCLGSTAAELSWTASAFQQHGDPRLRSSDCPAQGGERSLTSCLVARPSNIVRRESAKAGETKPGKIIVSSLSFPHLLPPEDQAGCWRGCAATSQEALHCLHPSQALHIWLLPLSQASIPTAAWERLTRGTKLTPGHAWGGAGLGMQS